MLIEKDIDGQNQFWVFRAALAIKTRVFITKKSSQHGTIDYREILMIIVFRISTF